MISIKFGPAKIAEGRFVAAHPIPDGAKLVFALNGKPNASISGTEAELEEIAKGIVAALDAGRKIKAG